MLFYSVIVVVVFVLSGLLSMAGLGAAFLFVPLFYYMGVPLPEATSTALLLNVVSLSFATVNYWRGHLMNLRIGLPVMITAVVLAPFGARLTAVVNTSLLLALLAAVGRDVLATKRFQLRLSHRITVLYCLSCRFPQTVEERLLQRWRGRSGCSLADSLPARLHTVWQRPPPSPAAARAGAAAAAGTARGLAAGPYAEAAAEDAAQWRARLRVRRERLVRHVLLELEVARLLAGRLRNAFVDVDGHAFSSSGLLRYGAEVALLRHLRLHRVLLVHPRLQHGARGVVGDLP